MHKTIIFILLISFILSACQKEQVPKKTITLPEIDLNVITETLSTVTEDALKDNFDGYEDYTAEILNSFQMNLETSILVPAILLNGSDNPVAYVYDTINDLSYHSSHVVRGTIIDLTYQTDGRHQRTTYYSFAVSEVLWGEAIAPETIITVREDGQGYLPLKLYRELEFSEAYTPRYQGEEEDRAYLVDTLDKSLAQIGEEYVLFLSDGNRFTADDITGDWYYITSGYGGKFRRNGDGLYERMIPEWMEYIFHFTGSLSLEELKEQIDESASKTEQK